MSTIQNRERKDLRRWDEFLFDDLFKDSFFQNPVGSMKTDIKETEEKYLLEIEMPGYDKKDVNISLEEGYLIISATKKYEAEENIKLIRRERFFGTTSRKYYVGDVEREKIEAEYKDGILYIDVPKEVKKPEEKKFIQIK